MNAKGKPAFTAYSAGSHPSGKVRPEALSRLQAAHIPVEGLRSKSWDEFAIGGPSFDLVLTVCDAAAGEACPVWPGRPITAHWGIADPAAAAGGDEHKRAAFAEAYAKLALRIERLLDLPFEELGPAGIRRELEAIGRLRDTSE